MADDLRWDDLRLFLLLARSGTLTAAAEALGVHASTTHRRLSALEAALGTDPARADSDEDGLSDGAEVLDGLVDEHGFSGSLLRAVRERQGQSLHDLADRTRISVRYLEAIEQEEVDVLPSTTFVRGYVREMARCLHLDPNALVTGYMQRISG